MKRNVFAHRARRLGVAGTAGMLAAAMGCGGIQDNLLEQQQPQIISPVDVQNATGAVGLYTGALGRLRTSLNGGNNNQEAIWNFTALLTDEVKSADTFSQRNDADQRTTQNNDGVMGSTYNSVQTARGRARDAIIALSEFAPTEKTKIAEMYMEMGFMELTLAQVFCNGIPLGETKNGVPEYTQPLTNADVFRSAIARADSGLAQLSGTDAATTQVRNALLVTKGRAQVNLGQFAAAATTVGPVPTSYAYLITYSQTTQSNEWWQMFSSTRRYTVGDSVDALGVIKNHLPFASANDPRVKVNRTTTRGFDNLTPFYELTNWAREDAISLVNGLDARLIEAEAQLQTGNYTGMTATLNALRTAPPKYGNLTIAALPALTAPTAKVDAENLFFREKAFWQYGRGERIADMRRLIRQYGRAADAVFPTGPFHKNGTYGTAVNFPVPDVEKSNPNFTGCLDRNA